MSRESDNEPYPSDSEEEIFASAADRFSNFHDADEIPDGVIEDFLFECKTSHNDRQAVEVPNDAIEDDKKINNGSKSDCKESNCNDDSQKGSKSGSLAPSENDSRDSALPFVEQTPSGVASVTVPSENDSRDSALPLVEQTLSGVASVTKYKYSMRRSMRQHRGKGVEAENEISFSLKTNAASFTESRGSIEGIPGAFQIEGMGQDTSIIEDEQLDDSLPESQDLQRTTLQASSTHGSIPMFVEAEAVEEVENQPVMATAKPDPWWRRHQWWLTGIALVLIFGITLTIVLTTSQIETTNAPSISPTTIHDGLQERTYDLIVSNLPGRQEELHLLDQSTPQYKAFTWIIKQGFTDPEFYTDVRILQQYALATFFFSTSNNDDPGNRESSWLCDDQWLINKNECEWYGVECENDKSGRVKGIDLSFNNISGTIPLDLAILSSSLTTLNLENNQISGSIPSEIQYLSMLTDLNLSKNQLDGNIPSSVGKLVSLFSLKLAKNELVSTIPTELGKLITLNAIQLGGNKLFGSIPPQIGSLEKLLEMDFSENNLSYAIPTEIGSLSVLRKIYLQDNKLLGPLPSQIGSLSSLESVNLSQNYIFDTIPNTLWQNGRLPNLEEVDLSHNLLTGTLATDFARSWNRLEKLNLGGRNFLKGGISSIIWPSTLKELDISSNFFTGVISSPITALSKLEVLDLSSNEFTGEFPPRVYNLENLRTLDLGGNKFQGSLSSFIGALSKLQTFGVSGVSGTIPVELYFLNRLERISLTDTSLSGTIASGIGSLSELKSLTIRGNTNLSGTIPASIGKLQALTHMDLSYNDFHGSIPSEIGMIPQLEELVAKQNELSGSIPLELFFLTSLRGVYLATNNLTGSLPTEIGYLTNLTSLQIGANPITGFIPSEIGSLLKMEDLRLTLTKLEGQFPQESRNFTNLKNLVLWETKLTGMIPEELCTILPIPDIRLDCSELVCYCCGCPEYLPSQTPSKSPMPTHTILPTRTPSSFPTIAPSTSTFPSLEPTVSLLPTVSPYPTFRATSPPPTDSGLCSAFGSIASYGSLLPFNEEEGQVVNLPFPFRFNTSDEEYRNITIDSRHGGQVFMGYEDLSSCARRVIGGHFYDGNKPTTKVSMGDVFTVYNKEDESFIISWEGAISFQASADMYSSNFQIVLFANGNIEIRWGVGIYPSSHNLIAIVADSCATSYFPASGFPFIFSFGPGMFTEHGVWPSNRCILFSTSNKGYITHDIMKNHEI